jgi:tripeptidyl-peptidase-1
MIVIATALLSLLGQVAFAKPLARDVVAHEQINKPPAGFSLSHAPAGDTVINIRFALQENDMDGLKARVMATSTPGNSEYGKHLSKEEVRQAH